jgi:hypothetical protein
MSSNETRGRMKPPIGIEVWRADELDQVSGRSDRWVYIGMIGRRSVVRSGFSSWDAACRAAWAAARGAASIPDEPEPEPYVEPKRYQPREPKPPKMRETYTIKFGSWDAMAADLLSQIIHDAGSLRRAAKIIGLPRSTFGARVRDYIDRGVWPTVK